MLSNKVVKIRYRKSTIIFILFTLAFSLIFYFIDGFLVGTLMVVVAVLYSSITHNCYGMEIYDDILWLRMIYSNNPKLKASNIKEVRLGKPHEEMRLMGNSRYLYIVLFEGMEEKYNIEPIASNKFENELENFCLSYNISFCKSMDY